MNKPHKKSSRNPTVQASKFKFVFNDRLAVAVIIGLIFLGSLTPVFKALANVPSPIGVYFSEAGNVLYRLRYQNFMMSETDCVGYFAYLRCAIIDHNLDFENDFRRFNLPDLANAKTSQGLTGNLWSVGPAILWAPAFMVGHGLSLLLNTLGFSVPTDGISFVYDFFIVFASMGYGLFGLLFIYRFLRFFFTPLISFMAFFILFYASALIFYEFNEPTMSHILTVFAVSGFTYYWYKTWQIKNYKDWLFLGLWGGLVILIRPQDIFFILFPIAAEAFSLAWQNKKLAFSFFSGSLLLSLTMAICFIPQMLAWKILYGSFLTIPQGSGFMQWGKPQIFPLLFSTNHGLITYTPIVFFSLLGLFLFNRENKRTRFLFWSFIAIFLAELYINSVVSDWNAGWSFGARRFLSCSIIFAWGLGNLLQTIFKYKKIFFISLGVFGLLIIFNLLFYVQWYYGLIPRADTLTWQLYFYGKIDAFRVWLKVMRYLIPII